MMTVRFKPYFVVKNVKYIREDYYTTFIDIQRSFDAIINYDIYISSAMYQFEGEVINHK